MAESLSMPRPLDFLIVGAPRCGTTSLFHHLRRHPEVFIPAAKELPFFTDEEWLARGWQAFLDEFFVTARAEQKWGKLTPHYWDPRVASRVRSLMPDVRLLALLRNPVDRTVSHYRFLVRRGVEPSPLPDAAFDPRSRKHGHYLPPGEYGRILEGYLEHFPRHQLLVLFTDDLERRPRHLLASVQRFLGLEEPFPDPRADRRYNVGGTATRLPWLVPFLRRTPARRIWRSLPARARRAVGHWYFFELAPRREPPPSLPDGVRRRLVEHFRPDVARLERILGRPVPWEEFRT